MNKYYFSLLVVTLFLFACNKTADTGNINPTPTPTQSKIAPDGFTYNNGKSISISINTLTNDNKPISEVPLNVYSIKEGAVDQLLYKGFTDAAGNFSTTLTIPNSYDTLIVDPSYIGLVRLAKVLIIGNTATCTIGGSKGYSGNIVGTLSMGLNLSTSQTIATIRNKAMGYNGTTKVKFVAMGTTDDQGRPNYLEPNPDIISADMLKSINTSLPEQKDVSKLHPQYISAGAASDIVVTEKADIWLTFTYEGAGNKNSIGYYKYPTNNPPKTMQEIDTIHFIFPNSSLVGSGGNMISGDKVKLGTFEAGSTIGLVLFSAGWNGTSVNYYAGGAFFTDSYMNPESNPDLKKHTVLLQYKNTYLIGFEDVHRDAVSCDQDFNDVVIYATSNPVTAISNAGVAVADTPLDTDKDGVTDVNDAFPTDPTRAYINYFPAEKTFGTLAYEDQWPVTGDYDINDLVVNYHYKIISNAQNNIVEFFADYVPVAAGATYYNGFGVAFPFSTAAVKTVTGQSLLNGYIKQNSNGTESGQTNAVIIPFDNHSNLIRNAGNAAILNTDMLKAKMTGDTAHIYLQFTSPISKASFGNAPFNPFAISNQRRTHEVHLPGNLPTDLADKNLLGTLQDATKIASNIFYVTKDNHPWALSFLNEFSYPTEGTDISKAYLHFLDWANSGGTLYTDWYSNTGSGYRNTANIYSK